MSKTLLISYEFTISTLKLDKKYKYLRSKQKKTFYLFYNLLDYALAYKFVESKTTNNNINKFLTNLFMALFIKKLLDKNDN